MLRFAARYLLFYAGCGNIIRQYYFCTYALVAQPVEHLTFNQRARDSSSLERTKIPRRIARFLVGFFFFRMLAHFCTLFAHRRESRVFPCIVCILCIVAELVGAKPLHLLSQTVLSLKSPTGAFIAPLRCANANFALQNACWEIPNPFKSAPSRRRLRDGIAEQHKGMLESRCKEKTAKQIKSTLPFYINSTSSCNSNSVELISQIGCLSVSLLSCLAIKKALPLNTLR